MARTNKLDPGPRPLDPNDPRVLQAVAGLIQAQRETKATFAHHPWPFLRDVVRTMDQITGKVRRVPQHEYLQFLVDLWWKTPLLLIPKSRRMIVTWALVACHVWLAIYRPGSNIAFMARKEGRSEAEGSAELVWRAKFILEHLPPTVATPTWEYQFCRIKFDNLSQIVGIAEGAEQLRQLTLTAILADEMAFWQQAYDTYVASRPTIEGGGRFTGVSSANPGFFAQMVFDRV